MCLLIVDTSYLCTCWSAWQEGIKAWITWQEGVKGWRGKTGNGAKGYSKLDAIFGRPKEAQEPPKQNEVIVIDSDSDTSLEFYEDTLKKPSASLVNKRPPKTWAKKIPISSIYKKKGSRSKNIPSSLDSIDDSSSSDESYDAKGHVQLKKRRMSKVSAPRPPRITNCVLGLPAGQKSLGTKFVMYF